MDLARARAARHPRRIRDVALRQAVGEGRFHWPSAADGVVAITPAQHGAMTQVLLFTRHDSIRQAALRLAETGQVQILEMG